MNTRYQFKDKEKFETYLKIQTRNFSELEDMCEEETIAIQKYLKGTKNILDFGCGIGRSSIYLKNALNMKARFYLADYGGFSNESEVNFPIGFHFDNKIVSLTNFGAIREFCSYNNLKNYRIIDLNTNRINQLNNIDVIYSFLSLGYHWSVEAAVEKYHLDRILNNKGIFICGVRKEKQIDENSSNFKNPNRKIGTLCLKDIVISNTLENYWIYENRK